MLISREAHRAAHLVSIRGGLFFEVVRVVMRGLRLGRLCWQGGDLCVHAVMWEQPGR